MKILAIETSCDETAAAVIEKNGSEIKILANVVASQINIHQKYGGIFPEIASRAHVEKIIPVVEQALACKKHTKVWSTKQSVTQALQKNVAQALACDKPDAIAVTTGPGLIGSLLVGVNFAKTYAYVKNLPIIGINHWLGHIYSNFVGKSQISKLKSQSKIPEFPSLILIASGGHTGLILMKNHDKIQTLGETLDDAAGEAFDKVAKLLGLGYPGGPAISTAAEKIRNPKSEIRNKSQIPKIKLPRPMLERSDFDFSFSGLKTAVLYKIKELTNNYHLKPKTFSAALAAEFQQAVIDILVGKTIQAAYQYRPKSICLCGGVSANYELREQLRKAVSGLPWNCSYHIPPMELTTDNAAMIGIAAAYHLDQKTSWDKINAEANLKL
jgi:N6-L-threonylcarbamoyladenine synthase